MAETTLRRALDGAEYVEFHPHRPVFVAWHGGNTYNVYTLAPGDETPVMEVDVFTVSDDLGEPLPLEEAKEKVNDYLARV